MSVPKAHLPVARRAAALAYPMGMRLFVEVTDDQWFHFLAGQPNCDEVNFWRPSGVGFQALGEGNPSCSKSGMRRTNVFAALAYGRVESVS